MITGQPIKNPTSETFTTNGYTKEGMFYVEFENIGDNDAIITNINSTTWVLQSGKSKSFSTGTPLDKFYVNVETNSTTVQVIYTY